MCMKHWFLNTVHLVRNVFATVYLYVWTCCNTVITHLFVGALRVFIVDCSLSSPQMHTTRTIIVHDCLSAGFVSCVNKRHLLVNYLHDVKDILQVYELSTGQLVRDLPLKVGTVCGVSCKKKHSEFFYKFTSFTTPGRWRMNISDRFSMSGLFFVVDLEVIALATWLAFKLLPLLWMSVRPGCVI